MYAKVHQKEGKRVIALCDRELIGKRFVDGDIELDLELYESFYRGNIVSKEEAINLLKKFDSINAVGRRSVDLCIKINLGTWDDVIYVSDIPMLQIYLI